MKNVIAILNQKGGVGKTTTAVNIGAYLARNGRKVLICDADPQGNATSGLGLDKNSFSTTLYEVLLGQASVDQAIQPTKVENLFILPSNGNLAGAEVQLVSIENREMQLKKVLEMVDYDYI